MQKGIPLSIDPFFQFLKQNYLAREVYLKKNDRFTVEKIIDIALRQDIGPDPSYSRVRKRYDINEKGRKENLEYCCFYIEIYMKKPLQPLIQERITQIIKQISTNWMMR